MESEKVKEIKKVLEECELYTINHHQKEGKPIKISFADILTLINELESENDTLHTNLCEWRKENKQLKDRIAELEKEKTEQLKYFAGKVKEKALSHCRTINCYELKFIEETIDELLEEYVK